MLVCLSSKVTAIIERKAESAKPASVGVQAERIIRIAFRHCAVPDYGREEEHYVPIIIGDDAIPQDEKREIIGTLLPLFMETPPPPASGGHPI